MGVKRRLAHLAVRRTHLLLAEVPGWWTCRVAVEQEAQRRGWVPALSPADADLLVVCGEPGTRLGPLLDAVWDQLPGPRARVDLSRPDQVRAGLDAAVTHLLDPVADSPGRQRAAEPVSAVAASDDMDMDGMDDMDMAPGGIALAEGAADRDGLEMDVLHLPLGPVLPYWPAGLVVNCRLHGDVVMSASAEVLEAKSAGIEDVPAVAAARCCDVAHRVLALVGWRVGAASAQDLRNDLLAGGDPEIFARGVERLRSRVDRSWTLRWMLRGLGTVDPSEHPDLELPLELCGDIQDRLLSILDAAVANLRGQPVRRPTPGLLLALVPRLVAGLDLAVVRVLVAGLDLDASSTVTPAHA